MRILGGKMKMVLERVSRIETFGVGDDQARY